MSNHEVQGGQAQTAHPLYFAYGSNLDDQDWLACCARFGVEGAPLPFVGTAILPDMALGFEFHSPHRAGGVLNIRPVLGQIVRGAVFAPDPAAWQRLDRKEGAPHVYQRRLRHAILPGGQIVPVITYELNPHLRSRFVEPDPAYLSIVRRGLQSRGLSTATLDQVAQGEAVQPEIDGVFCYGTLMRGESRFQALSQVRTKLVLAARTPGQLMSTEGDYPALRLPDPSAPDDEADNEQGWVHGDYFRIDDIARLLPVLDRIEGFDGHANPNSLFVRTVVDLAIGDGELHSAWCYIAGPTCPLRMPIPSGNWRVHQGVQEVFIEELVDAYQRRRPGLIERLGLYCASSEDCSAPFVPPQDRTTLVAALQAGTLSEFDLVCACNRQAMG